MRPKLFSTLLSSALVFSCSNINSSKFASTKSWFDTSVYPKQKFYSVTLFTLYSSQKTTISSDFGTFVDTSILEYVGNAGYSFVSKEGIPKTKNFKSYKLDSTQIERLESFLVQQPCTDRLRLEKACAPTFRNVFVFYDSNQKSIAQVHICFHCEMTAFNPNEEYMCDFDNKINYKALKKFVDSVKR